MFIIDDILLSPIKGLSWLGKKIQEMAKTEVSDEGKIKEELMALQLRFELDEISEPEYMEEEKKLLDRLEAVKELNNP